MKEYLARQAGKPKNAFKDKTISEDEKQRVSEILIKAEKDRDPADKKTAGDASESGLIKFVQDIYDIEEYRNKYPIHHFENEGKMVESIIPFSSEIKFNMFIRDMNKNVSVAKDRKDNLMVVMKGAPERILNRCSKILFNGVEREFDEFSRKEVNAANE